MKKITVILLALVMTFSCFAFTGCSVLDSILGDSEKTFSKSGISITLTDEFYEKDYISYTVYLESPDALVAVVKEDFSLFTEIGISTDISLKDYAEMAILANQFNDIASDIVEEDGLTYYTYESEEDGDTYYYACYVFRGTDAYWLVNMACFADRKDDFQPKFNEWAKSVVVD